MKLTVEPVNLPEITRKYDPEIVDEPVEGMFKRLGGDLVKTMGHTVRETTNTITGDLAGQWEYVDGKQQVETDVSYARFIDRGTRFITPRRFVDRTIKKSASDVRNRMDETAAHIEREWTKRG